MRIGAVRGLRRVFVGALVIFVCAGISLSIGGEMSDSEDTGKNLLQNGGFEEWVDKKEKVAEYVWTGPPRKPTVAVQVKPEGQWPMFWVPGCSAYEKDVPLTGIIVRDEETVHSGQYSLRIESDQVTNITHIDYSPHFFKGGDVFKIKANRRYRLSWWVKGKDVEPGPDGPGQTVASFYIRKEGEEKQRVHNKWSHQVNKAPTGSFDWQRQSVEFTTNEVAPGQTEMEMTFSLQLRRAKGTVWYDDVELVDLGPVVKVETF